MEKPRRIFIDSNRTIASPMQKIDYRGLLQKYFLSKWYFYLLSGIVFVGLAYLYAQTQQPQFEVKSKLLVREAERDNYSKEDWLKRSLSFSTAAENVYNEIQVLTSFELMSRVVKDLDLEIQYFWKTPLYTRDGYQNFPILIDSFQITAPGLYDSSLEFIPVDERSFQLFDGEKERTIGTFRYGELITNQFGYFRFRRNESVPFPVDSTMHVYFASPEVVTEDYQQRLSVDFVDIKSTTLELTLNDAIPARGIDVLERLIERYNQLEGEKKNEISLKTLEFIDERLADIGSDLKSIETSVERFKLRNDIASETTSDLQIMLQNVNDLNKNQDGIRVQLNILQSMQEDLFQAAPGDFELIPANLSITSNEVREMIQPYNELVLQRRQLLITGQPSNPLVQSATQQLTSLRKAIISALANLEQDLQLQLNQLQGQYSQSVARIRSVPTKERELLDREREQSIVERLYIYLLEKREETALSLVSASSSSSIVIDPPRSSIDAVSPNKKLFYFAGLVFGFGLPFFFITVADTLDQSIESEATVREILPEYGVVGLINRSKGKKRPVVLQPEQVLSAERFRSLRNNLQFIHKNKQKRILVTSSTSGEGKTFVAANLATSFALAKQKTILVDFDLRNPSVAKELSVKGPVTPGLVDFLSTDDMDLEKVIRQSQLLPNLFYIPSGDIPVNSSELVYPERKFRELFDYLGERYESILIDSSPIGIVSDAILLSSYVTSTLYVVSPGVTQKQMLANARELFEQQKLVKPSIVINGIKKGDVYGYNL